MRKTGQFGQDIALSLISFPHSGHLISAIIFILSFTSKYENAQVIPTHSQLTTSLSNRWNARALCADALVTDWLLFSEVVIGSESLLCLLSLAKHAAKIQNFSLFRCLELWKSHKMWWILHFSLTKQYRIEIFSLYLQSEFEIIGRELTVYRYNIKIPQLMSTHDKTIAVSSHPLGHSYWWYSAVSCGWMAPFHILITPIFVYARSESR